MKEKVAVLGAGISGLIAAYELTLKGYEVEIFERDDKIGGKICSLEIRDHYFDVGAVTIPHKAGLYNNIKALSFISDSEATESKFSVVPFRDVLSGSSNFPTHPLTSELQNILQNMKTTYGFHNYIRCNDEIKRISESPLPCFLKDFGLAEQKPFTAGLRTWYCGYGYCNDPSIATLLFLKISSEIGNFYGHIHQHFGKGIVELCHILANYLTARGVAIHLNANIKNIVRSEDCVCFVHEKTLKSFGSLIISCPSQQIIEQVLSNPSEEEQLLMSSISYLPYASILVEFDNLPFEGNSGLYGYLYEEDVPLGHFNNFFLPYPNLPVAVFYSYVTRDMTEDMILTNLKKDLQKLYGSDFSMVKVHFFKVWSYMPHYQLQQIRDGYYQRFDAIQGTNHTFYCGGLFNGETVESCTVFARHLIDHFYPNLTNPLPLPEMQLITRKKEFIFQMLLRFPTVLHALKYWATHSQEKSALVWYIKGEPQKTMNYGQLWTQIGQEAQQLKQYVRKGERAMLLFEPSLEFFVSFFACLLVGILPVPYYPPAPATVQKGIDLLEKVLVNAECYCVIMSSSLMHLKTWRGKWPASLNGQKIKYITSGKSHSRHQVFREEQQPMLSDSFNLPEKENLAFLQYTSGSTGDPKGVMIGHDNLQYHSMISAFSLFNDSTTGTVLPEIITTSWLPQYHDMGLALNTICPLTFGGTVHAFSPLDFLSDPLIWMDILSTTHSTHALAPNFAFGLLSRKWQTDRAKRWDLSHLRMLGNSSEPILDATVTTFLTHMKEDVPSFRGETAYLPGYGMAECVAFIGTGLSGSPLITSTSQEGSSILYASIPYVHRFDAVAIVSSIEDNKSRKVLKEKEIGEIWLCSPSIARGYWNNPVQTMETFHNYLPYYDRAPSSTPYAIVNDPGYEHAWLRTGDLGFLENGHLFISGRLKDVIIIRGRNFFPQDIEQMVVDVAPEQIRAGSVVAFQVSLQDTEGYVVVAEVRQSKVNSNVARNSYAVLAGEIQRSLESTISGSLVELLLVKERTVPKTTSGKVQRTEMKRRWSAQLIEASTVLYHFSSSMTLAVAKHNIHCHSGITAERNDPRLKWLPGVVLQTIKEHLLPKEYKDQEDRIRVLLERYLPHCRSICEDYQILEPDLPLVQQGLDSLKMSELSFLLQDLHTQVGLVQKKAPVLDMSALYEWKGSDLIQAICGVIPTSSVPQNQAILFPLSMITTVPGVEEAPKPSKPILFMIHSRRGYAGLYKMVAESLSAHFQVYGLNCPNMMVKEDQEMVFLESLPALARDYLPRIQAIAPTGPYHLGGHCFGEVLSLELARLLQSRDEVVDTMILLDAPFHSQNHDDFSIENEWIYRYHLQLIDLQEHIERNVRNALYLQRLLFHYYPASPLLQPIARLVLVRGEGSLIDLWQQSRSGLNWTIGDLFAGMRHFLSPQQRFLHFGTLFEAHANLFDGLEKESFNALLTTLLTETTENDAFDLQDVQRNVRIAIQKKSLYLLRGFLAEALEEEIANVWKYKNYQGEGKTLLHLAVEKDALEIVEYLLFRRGKDGAWFCDQEDIFGHRPFHYASRECRSIFFTFQQHQQQQLYCCFRRQSMSFCLCCKERAFHNEYTEALEEEGALEMETIYPEATEQSLVRAIEEEEIPAMTTTMTTTSRYLQQIEDQYRREHSIEFARLFAVLQERMTWSFIRDMIMLILQQSPAIALTQVCSLVTYLLLLRLISNTPDTTISLPLIAAMVLDNIIVTFGLSLASQFSMAMPHHLVSALDSNRPELVQQVFQASLVLTVIPAGTLLLGYGLSAGAIGQALNLEKEVVDAWSLLAYSHLLGLCPALVNLSIDAVFHSVSYRQCSAWGALIEGIVTLSCASLFQTFSSSSFNGLSIGFALSLGHWSRFFFDYLALDLFLEFCQRFRLFALFPLPIQTITARWTELKDKCWSSVFLFSNLLVIVLLLSNTGSGETSLLSLIVFAITNGLYRIVNLSGSIFSISIGLISFRMNCFHNLHFKNGFTIRALGMLWTVVLGGILAIPLYCLTGEQATRLFFNVDRLQMSLILTSSFYQKVETNAVYFLTLALINCVSLPTIQFLWASLSFYEQQWISFLIHFVLGNACLILSHVVDSSTMDDYLILEGMVFSGLAMIGYLYIWWKMTDVEILFFDNMTIQHFRQLLPLQKSEANLL